MNIFQIWEQNGKQTPFIVKRQWSPENFVFIVEKIECEKMPYGKAYGYSNHNGVTSKNKNGEINCAGCYHWEYIGKYEFEESYWL